MAGIVANVAVAWACSLWLEVFSGEYVGATKRLDSSRAIRVCRFSRMGATYFESRRLRGWQPGNQGDLDDVIPRWTGLQTPGPAYGAGHVHSEHRGVDLRGWPMPCLWLELVSNPSDSGTLSVAGGVDTGKLRQVTWSATPRVLNRHGHALPLALPIRPLWPAFAVNTMFYAMILWLLLPGAFALRRFLRRRRSLCPACGYPMGEATVCTECGRSLPGRAVV
jgi:hypothetical protein